MINIFNFLTFVAGRQGGRTATINQNLKRFNKVVRKIQKGKSETHIMRTCFVSKDEIQAIKELMRERGVL